MKKVKNLFIKIPYIRKLRKYKTLFPPGHENSPIPSREEILKREDKIFGIKKKEIAGIDLNEKGQLELLKEIKKYYDEIPFADNKKDGFRYYYDKLYPHADAIFLYCVMRHFRPNKIIEIGSGFSSAVMLDTSEHFLEKKTKCYFIDPYPKQLLALLNEFDKRHHKIINSYIQDINLDFFKQLNGNDILFVDGSHVSKTGSDVNYIIFDILPNLNSGVLIHFHDIFYPFEYPKDWVLAGRAWNESYILRAFLQYNTSFKIVLFNTFLEYYYENWFARNMPLCLENKGGSIWLQKL